MVLGDPPGSRLGEAPRLSHPQGKRRGQPQESAVGEPLDVVVMAWPCKAASKNHSRQSVVKEQKLNLGYALGSIMHLGKAPKYRAC